MRADAPRQRDRSIVRIIQRWYALNGRDLPWRRTTNPYHVLVSEIMLQQTQVSRVLDLYPVFLRRFPTMAALANAGSADVVRAWKGMGYNNRAIRLQQTVRILRERHEGTIPGTDHELRALPGVGPYTAAALRCFIHRAQIAVVDVNIRRVLSRVFGRMPLNTDVMPAQDIDRLARRLIPAKGAYDWNQALMDLGAMICRAREPACDQCPVAGLCRSRSTMVRGHARPRPEEKKIGGIPVRIVRGRIVDALRALRPRETMKLSDLHVVLPEDGRMRGRETLVRLTDALARDGIISVSGPLRDRRVGLR